jgi:DNA polymerase-3 subunit epsilon
VTFFDEMSAPEAPVLPRVLAEGRYVVLDIEATGLSRAHDETVQVAFGHVDGGVVGLRGFYWVRPACAISRGAANVHGFTSEGLRWSPPFARVAQELLAIIGDRIVLGHGVKQFDVPMLARQFGECGLEWRPRMLDTVLWSRRLVKDGRHSLGVMAERFGIVTVSAHDAWHDCRMTWNVFGQLAFRFPELGALSPDDASELYTPKETK